MTTENAGSYIRCFGSKREANDMMSVLVRHGFGPRSKFIVQHYTVQPLGTASRQCRPLFELCLSHQDDTKTQIMSHFLRGWIACTNTKQPRPKVQ